MTNNIVAEVVDHVRRGRAMMVRRDHSGNCVIKFNTGPFGLIKKRYVTDSPTFELIKADIRKAQ